MGYFKKVVALGLTLITLCGILCSCGSEKKKEPVLTNPQPISEDTTERLFKVNGFDETNRRKEIKFDESKGLNSRKVKLYIYDRALNSVDYIENITGNYYYSPSSGNPGYVSYSFSQGKKPQSEELYCNAQGDLIGYFYFDGTTQTGMGGEDTPAPADENTGYNKKICKKIAKEREKLSLDDFSQDMTYEQSQVDLETRKHTDYVKLVNSQHRVCRSETTGKIDYFYRDNLPLLPNASIQYQPQYYAFRMLEKLNKWDVNGVEKHFGRECFSISGKVQSDYAGQLNAKTFEMLVDKKTGVLVSLEAYDMDGNTSIQLISYELIINK